MLSRKTDYALRAITYLMLNQESRLPTRIVAEKLGIPYKFLTQIFLELVRKGILTSQRGSRGGMSVRKKPEEISLLDIIEAVEGPFSFHQCLSDQHHDCFFSNGCPIKEKLADVEKETIRILKETTLDKIKAKYYFEEED